MNDYPTVSVVTPSYNQGEFLSATIESVLSQAGDFFIDYIIMDGGSTDNSVEIMQRYEKVLERSEWPVACKGITFRWKSEKDNGQADAVNKGFAVARGTILGWLNSDDTYMPGAVANVLESFRANPDTVMIYGNAWFTDRQGNITGSYSSAPFNLEKLAVDCYICQPSVFVRTEALEEIGHLDINLHTSMDYDLWIRMGKSYESRIAFIETYLATSRMYVGNKSFSLRKLIYKEIMAIVYKHFGYVPAKWIIHCILEVIQTADIRSLPKTICKLYNRLFVFRYLVQFETMKSIVVFSISKIKKSLLRK